VLTELNGLKDELQDIKKAILSKPETNIELGEIVGATMSIVKSVKKGNSVTYNKYKIK
jgi:beta-lactam-binding protein with PASTA domain